MSYYTSAYQKRLNRYGLNYQERVMTQRREVFARMLLKSVYRIDFTYNNNIYPATFERYTQTNTKTLRYLLTPYDVIIPNGTVLMLPDPIGLFETYSSTEITYPETSKVKPDPSQEMEDDELRPWMVYYLEDTGAKGYNRYIMLRMTHYLTWIDRNREERNSYAYMYGQEDNMLKDELKSRSRMDAIYTENLKSSFFIIPANPFVRKDDYFIIDKDINHKVLEEYYRVTGYDIQSQDGVEYVTVDPIYEYSDDFYEKVYKAPLPKKEEETEQEYIQRKEDYDNQFYWLQGDIEEGEN